MEHLLGVLQVQTYVINGEPVAFFDKRAISRKGKPKAIRCKECGMGLQDAGVPLLLTRMQGVKMNNTSKECGRGLQDTGCLFCSLRSKVRRQTALAII